MLKAEEGEQEDEESTGTCKRRLFVEKVSSLWLLLLFEVVKYQFWSSSSTSSIDLNVDREVISSLLGSAKLPLLVLLLLLFWWGSRSSIQTTLFTLDNMV